MSLMDRRHVVIRFDDENDLDLSLARNHRFFLGIGFEIFKWRPGFSIQSDPRIVPIWIDLPFLKFEFLAPSLMKAIGDNIGQFSHG